MPHLPSLETWKADYNFYEDIGTLLQLFFTEDTAAESHRVKRHIPYYDFEADLIGHPQVTSGIIFAHLYFLFYLFLVVWILLYDWTIKFYGLPLCKTPGLLAAIYTKVFLCIDGDFNNWPLAILKPKLETLDEAIDLMLWPITTLPWHPEIDLSSLDNTTYDFHTGN